MNRSSNYLGIDWGEKKVGIALAHAETKVAVAYAILNNDHLLPEQLKKIVTEEEIGTLVVGVPRFLGGSQGKHPAKEFGEKIERVLGVAVVYVDEIFTTKLAQEHLKSLGEKGIGARDDAEAAKVFLQDWLGRS